MPGTPHPDPIVRPERPDETAARRNLIRTCFPTGAEADLTERIIRDGHPSLSVVMALDDAIIGQAFFSAVGVTHGKQSNGAALAPFCVHPDWQGRGLGRRLLKESMPLAEAGGWRWIVVLGEPHIYATAGFERAGRFGIRPPFEVPDINYMVRELVPGALRDVSGTVIYATAFESVTPG